MERTRLSLAGTFSTSHACSSSFWSRHLAPFRRSTSNLSSNATPHKFCIFSGIQPTGKLHLGNYLGAISNWVELQNKHQGEEMIFSIVDMHSLTSTLGTKLPSELAQDTREMAIALLSCGIDPEKATLYPQSAVSGHAELMWILSCKATMGELNKMTQYKEKKATQGAMLGLFSYPVLMAADILLYRATHVPVGNDQLQHLELARGLAEAFDKTTKTNYFPLPQPLLTKSMRVMSLRNGMAKMSKSDESDKSRINLCDDDETIRIKIQKAKTDCIEKIYFNPQERPEVANLLSMYSALSHTSVDEICEMYSRGNIADFKNGLADCLINTIGPIREKMAAFNNKPGLVDEILNAGAVKANKIARKNIQEIKKLVGLFSTSL